MSAVPQQAPAPAPPQPTASPSSSVNMATVTTALQALKEGNADSSIVNALLHLIQPVDQAKGAAAETLSTLSQSAGTNHQPNIHPQLQDTAGPNSHPHGPPMLGVQQSEPAPAASDTPPSPIMSSNVTSMMKSARRRGGPPVINGAVLNNEEWTRQRKDNHKEVERRRRGNINEGIYELSRIVPNGTGEKAKGAILARSVQYIHHLKENEARNIEKWTLEKLLMDQAMGDLQSQLADLRHMWQEEVKKREKAESELASIKAELALANGGKKRTNDSDDKADKDDKEESEERNNKRPRAEA